MGNPGETIIFVITVVAFSVLMVLGLFTASHTYVKHAHDPYHHHD